MPYKLFLLLCIPTAALAQGLTGEVSGRVRDSAGAIVSGAQINLTNAGTGQARNSLTDTSGEFKVTDVLPGIYHLTATMAGFKKYQQDDIVVTATERVVLRDVTLELGELTQTVRVTAEAPHIQSRSSERSGLVSSEEITELGLKGRDYMELLSLLPGVVDTASREAPGWNNLVGITVNGNREGSTNLTLDGVSNRDTGSNTGPYLAPGMDAIAEVKVLLSNYQAEYGRSSGGAINVVIKNGTKEFHGGAFLFVRNEALNANGFFYNRDGLARVPYRFTSPGYNLGGPGVNNWDISLFKNAAITADGKHRLQLRFEAYNAYNHVQFSAEDTAARFDAQGNNVNGRFGQYTAARDARRVQAGLKYLW